MRIGFFGDSFSHENAKIPQLVEGFSTYISLLEKEYKTKIPIKSRGGTNHWDVIINQFIPNINNLPDICIFTWPDENRLFHREIRNLRRSEALEYSNVKNKLFDINYNFGRFKNQWQAAEMFYKHLFDEEKNNLEYLSSLYYFDNVILEKIKDKKFIHLWSFNNVYNWKNSITLEQPLIKIAESMIPGYHDGPPSKNKNYLAFNHLPGQELNDYVFEKVKTCINEVCK
jgi:hypothetical protein